MIVAPNFAIGAVLMQRFAAEAARFCPAVEIIELHHDGKVDSPSGTALDTAMRLTRERERWAGAVDAVGGPTLAYLIRTMAQGGGVAVSGNTGGAAVATTVFPFILRGVNVLGMDSAQMPLERRIDLWRRLAADLRPPRLEETITREISLEQVPEALSAIQHGEVRGRTVVRVSA